MSRTKVKICGITSPDDAVLCHELGADYLGIIFADSPRKINSASGREIRGAVPTANLVGVFLDADLDVILETANSCGLNMVQLHGAESPEFVASLADRSRLPVVKAFKAGQTVGANPLSDYKSSSFFLFDLDKTPPSSDQRSNALWSEAAAAVRARHRVFLAGGLTPGNVGAAVKRVRPYCVDVCGGVEAAPGVKDAGAVRRFIAEVMN
jgi:phosphoribosylanthranilate isomerase